MSAIQKIAITSERTNVPEHGEMQIPHSFVVLYGGLNTRIGRTSHPSGVSFAEAVARALAHLDAVFPADGVRDHQPWVYSEVLPRLRGELMRLKEHHVEDRDRQPSVDWIWPVDPGAICRTGRS